MKRNASPLTMHPRGVRQPLRKIIVRLDLFESLGNLSRFGGLRCRCGLRARQDLLNCKGVLEVTRLGVFDLQLLKFSDVGLPDWRHRPFNR